MATIRMTTTQYEMAWHHMFDTMGEHFVFFLANWTIVNNDPIFLVEEVILIPDDQLQQNERAYDVSVDAILSTINAAVRGNYCLIEAHNHGGQKPRFSVTDRRGFEIFIKYVHESLPNRPYAATVWGDDVIYGEYFLVDGKSGIIESITSVGNTKLSQLRSYDDYVAAPTHTRQFAWFSERGQEQLEKLKIAVVGCGGTGSHIIQNLAYLGCRNFILIDSDCVDITNMNRLVTATWADVDTPKTIIGRRLIRSVAPSAMVSTIHKDLSTLEALDSIKGVDVIWGCVDNDGARLVLNDLAVAYRIPYFDVATGIELESNSIDIIGGRVAVVLPNNPCLNCMYEIDTEEASYFLAADEDRVERVERGYITGVDIPAPSVVSLNAIVSAIAVNEFAVYSSGLRPINLYSEYNLLGQAIHPTKQKVLEGCVTCTYAGKGDVVDIARFARC